MSCPNCGSYSRCNCTWSEQHAAINLIRRREAAYRCKIGHPTVVEEERQRREKEP